MHLDFVFFSFLDVRGELHICWGKGDLFFL